MKKNLLLLISLCVTAGWTSAQVPAWTWAASGGGSSADAGSAMATDGNGNTYVTGYFSSTSATFGTSVLSSAGGYDMFIVKYDPSGNVAWARRAGGSSTDMGLGVGVDGNGNVYVTGSSASTILTFDTISLIISGGNGFFLARYDNSGNIVWARSTGGSSNKGTGIAVDNGGNSYVTGLFTGSITFGPTTLTSHGDKDLFIVKYTNAGNVAWATNYGGSLADQGNCIALSSNGSVYLSGVYRSASITFGPATLTNTGNNDLFLVRLDTAGAVSWCSTASGANSEFSVGMAADGSGNVYLTGWYSGANATFGSVTLTNHGSVSSNDMFIAKYDAAGAVSWAYGFGGSGYDYGNGIVLDGAGNFYVTGIMATTFSVGATVLTSNGSWDILLAKLDTSGSVIWATNAGSIGTDFGNAVALNNANGVCVTGSFQSTLISFGSTVLPNHGSDDMFVARMAGGLAGIRSIGQSELEFFPNPFSSRAVLYSGHFLQKATLTLVDMSGRRVLEMTGLSGQAILVQRGALKAGIYLACIREEDEILLTKKVIVTEQ
jgi:hypothetical protein